MIKLLISIFQVLPELIGIVKVIIKKVQEAQDRYAKKALAQGIREGLTDAAENKNTAKLEAIFRGHL